MIVAPWQLLRVVRPYTGNVACSPLVSPIRDCGNDFTQASELEYLAVKMLDATARL
jgi:hypothetical protein